MFPIAEFSPTGAANLLRDAESNHVGHLMYNALHKRLDALRYELSSPFLSLFAPGKHGNGGNLRNVEFRSHLISGVDEAYNRGFLDQMS